MKDTLTHYLMVTTIRFNVKIQLRSTLGAILRFFEHYAKRYANCFVAKKLPRRVSNPQVSFSIVNCFTSAPKFIPSITLYFCRIVATFVFLVKPYHKMTNRFTPRRCQKFASSYFRRRFIYFFNLSSRKTEFTLMA